MDYCVIKTKDGRQEKVSLGDIIEVNKISDAGEIIDFEPVLVVKGDDFIVDIKDLAATKVIGTFIADKKGPKIIIQKFKNKVRSRVKKGHRQSLTRVRITQIGNQKWEGK